MRAKISKPFYHREIQVKDATRARKNKFEKSTRGEFFLSIVEARLHND